MNLRIYSSGGGVQSIAALILSARGEIDYPVHLFANVGDDSENPETLDYVRDIAMPYAEREGVEFHEINWIRRDGTFETLREYIYRTERSVPIPALMSGSGAPGRRSCTFHWKIKVVDRWIAEHDGKGKDVFVGLGITVDEIHRARIEDWQDVRGFRKLKTYPLIELGISRNDCHEIIRDAGLPTPAKSSCYFCPFHTPAAWTRLRLSRPDLFDEACNIEKEIQRKRREVMGKDDVFLHPALLPLAQAVGHQMSFDELENCESGYCMT